jgi:outer membrane protein assembly factor BamB
MGTVRSLMVAAVLCCTVPTSRVHAQSGNEWYTYRYNAARTGDQPFASALSDPNQVGGIQCVWAFPPDGICAQFPPAQLPAGPFQASPIVVNDTVFIGDTNGYFYALDAASGNLKWVYPHLSGQPTVKDTKAALTGTCVNDKNNFGNYGIQSSATYATINGQDAVIFGAPDPNPNTDGGRGSARLFALDFSGNPIWKYDGVRAGSAVVARVTGCNAGAMNESHERIAYSSPLVLGDKVYVGIHDRWDNPLQQGRVSVVELSSGKLVSFDPSTNPNGTFSYVSTGKPGDGSRGGGIWNSLATDGTGVYFTTGNTRSPPCNSPYTGCSPVNPPIPNYGLSMVRVDKDTGHPVWPKPVQPVDFNHDGDPDWAAGAAVMSTSCGELIASVQKDGWSYAVNASDGSLRWQFPPTIQTDGEQSFLNDVHGNDDYKRPGAAWNDVLIINTGGEANTDDSPCPKTPSGGRTACRGYSKLHALNACATNEQDRVRWIADLSAYSTGGIYSISAPTVTGGIVYVGTDKGQLVVLGDPQFAPQTYGQVCSNIDYPVSVCPARYAAVYSLNPLKVVQMPDMGNIAGLRKEAAIAARNGRIYVSTQAGHVYMLAVAGEGGGGPPPPPPPQCGPGEIFCDRFTPPRCVPSELCRVIPKEPPTPPAPP